MPSSAPPGDAIEQLAERRAAAVEIRPKIAAFADAHRVELVERGGHGVFDARREPFVGGIRLFAALRDRERLRKPQQVARGHRARYVPAFPGAVERGAERVEEGLVQLHFERRDPPLGDGDRHLDAAAAHPLLGGGTQA